MSFEIEVVCNHRLVLVSVNIRSGSDKMVIEWSVSVTIEVRMIKPIQGKYMVTLASNIDCCYLAGCSCNLVMCHCGFSLSRSSLITRPYVMFQAIPRLCTHYLNIVKLP